MEKKQIEEKSEGCTLSESKQTRKKCKCVEEVEIITLSILQMELRSLCNCNYCARYLSFKCLVTEKEVRAYISSLFSDIQRTTKANINDVYC